jgi:hypothetical protein
MSRTSSPNARYTRALLFSSRSEIFAGAVAGSVIALPRPDFGQTYGALHLTEFEDEKIRIPH